MFGTLCRISKGLLLNVFDKVEMVDTCSEHLESAKGFMVSALSITYYLGSRVQMTLLYSFCCPICMYNVHPQGALYNVHPQGPLYNVHPQGPLAIVLLYNVHPQGSLYNVHPQGPLFERVSAQHCTGLEDFSPSEACYDCVWIQWVIIYLSDYDFIRLLGRHVIKWTI